MQEVTFYFDFLSPYSYFAWKNWQTFVGSTDLKVKTHYRPVLLAGLLNHHQQKGPAEIPAKRAYLFRDCLRYSEKHSIPFNPPATHPFNPLYALRLALVENTGEELQQKVIDCLWRAGWETGIDMGNPEALSNALTLAQLPAGDLMEKTFLPEVKNALKRNTKEAIEHEAFGVPSFLYQNEIFWGNDSLEYLEQALRGKDNLNRSRYEELLKRTPQAARQQLNI